MSFTVRACRLHHTIRLPFLYTWPTSHVNFSQRQAMRPALSHSHAPSSSTTRASSPSPQLPDSSPVVIPSTSSLPHDAASPQTVARPPPAPKAEKPRPKLKSTKAALTIVCPLYHLCIHCLTSAIDYRHQRQFVVCRPSSQVPHPSSFE
jgi:hypothetical protein